MEKNLGILGGGESGVGAALLARKHGWNVFVSDFGKISEAYKKELSEAEIEFEEGEHSLNKLKEMDLIVKSPGIPPKVPIIMNLEEAGVSISSEIDFASRYCSCPVIAITGSNGKTTTTSLIHHILTKSGLNCALGGNIGESFSRVLLKEDYDYAVVEVSSFQLENLLVFKPSIAVVCNITPDHLDRYEYSFELYAEAKMNITKLQTKGDHFIYNMDDAYLTKWIEKQALEFNSYPIGGSNLDSYLRNATGEKMPLNLLGKHNKYNAAMAVCVAEILEISDEEINESLASFKAIEHRLEVVIEHNGVKYINDSKATNVDAVYYALDGIEGPIIWLVGGVDKGNDYSQIFDLVKEKVKSIVILSKHPEKIEEAFGALDIPSFQTEKTKDAIEYAKGQAENGDVILLSPACASFDLFENYEDRGDQFRREVLKITKGENASSSIF